MLLTKGSSCDNLLYDEACLRIYNKLNDTVTVYGQYDQCHKCDFQNLTTLAPYQNSSLVINTRSPFELYYVNSANVTHCSFKNLFYEHYEYGWNISEKCTTAYIQQPADNAYLPILTAFIVLFFIGTAWYMVKCIYKNSHRLRSLLTWNTELEDDLGSSSMGTPLVIERIPSVRKHPHRVKSIDVFRGLCIMLMIFVNYGGGKYWFFQHSAWNGLTVADLIFPWFLWLMGMSLSISLQSKLRRAVPRRTLIVHVIRRFIILLLLGIVINSNKNLSTIADIRLPGVLQRIAFTYLIVGLLEVCLTKRMEIENASPIFDIVSAWPQWLFITCIIIIHTCVTYLVEVPGCGRGYVGPGGLDEHEQFVNCTGGVAGYIDREVFGRHMYKGAVCRKVYETKQLFDPEGILSTFTSILTVYLGVQAGRTLNTYQNVRSKVIRWMIWGIGLSIIGAGLAEFKRNDGLIPINKQLWSLSYVFVTGGFAFIIQTGLFLAVDIFRKWGGRPFFYPGMNAIILYVGHELFNSTFPFAWKPTTQTHGTFLFMNLWGTALWVSISIYMYKHNVFVSI
ncbi:heparan-alpha-glucosaminide N-acetyltransferase-like [Aethina tumida]|uniref:heparan-alpha-glucosaminide N-acetyltransferase-like n=1 Tax=Aethina tumida TaxID=116153 RepID=UPI00096B40D7|nr:heparan-alpha-glucosaminide N-acetyltransferase-like [Aethina tumida]